MDGDGDRRAIRRQRSPLKPALEPIPERTDPMKVLGLDMVLVFVTDMDRSLAWYQDRLGLKLLSRHGDFAVLDTGGVPLALHGGGEPEAGSRNHGTLASFRVADYAAAKAQLEEAGSPFVFENQQGNSVFGTFLDPDGTPLQIIQRG
jgi:catechol 2,3-dioxygenase-like lactoylglutathione lyase family enzyme